MVKKISDLMHENVINLRKAGLTYAEIGRRVNISREWIRQIITGRSSTKKEPPPRNDPNFLLTTSQAAHLLNVHTNTLMRWSKKGIIDTFRIGPRGDRRFRQQDIDNLILKMPKNGTS